MGFENSFFRIFHVGHMDFDFAGRLGWRRLDQKSARRSDSRRLDFSVRLERVLDGNAQRFAVLGRILGSRPLRKGSRPFWLLGDLVSFRLLDAEQRRVVRRDPSNFVWQTKKI